MKTSAKNRTVCCERVWVLSLLSFPWGNVQLRLRIFHLEENQTTLDAKGGPSGTMLRDLCHSILAQARGNIAPWLTD
jgi:hypothetical protein